MKYDSFDDKQYFIYGALLSGKKVNFTSLEENTYYQRNTYDQLEVDETVPAVTSGLNIKQITSGVNQDEQLTLTDDSNIGRQAATLALDWQSRQLTYSQRYKNEPNCFDNASFIARVYHTVIDNDNDFAIGETGYDGTCLSSCSLQELLNLCVSWHSLIAVNCYREIDLIPGDIVFYSNTTNNFRDFHISSAALYIGNHTVVKADQGVRAIVQSSSPSDNVMLIARPSLHFGTQDGLTIPADKIGFEHALIDGTPIDITVFVDEYAASAKLQFSI